jgi:PPOX class probable F420-dependent enzyme
MGVRLSEAETTEFLEASHTGILSTLRADGSPASVPLWFVVLDGSVYFRTLAESAKAKHLRKDPRVAFLVESGEAWKDLKAVVLSGTGEIQEDAAVKERVEAAINAKYADHLMPESVPDATQEHYAVEPVIVKIVPERRTLTWDNSKLTRKD